MMRPLVIDNFAGGGGASTGIERALGRAVDIAINHDAEAVAMHAANQPGTVHHCQSIMAIDPLAATDGAPVALAWFSPDCKHHSKAKGGKPREKHLRDLAWIVPHWAERLIKATPGVSGAPQVIMLENVEEFRQWGPLDAEGKPIAERRGEEFDLWLRRLRKLGYRVEHRELRACDYGAPTSRKRLFLIARRDGRPIVWPTPTHGKPGSTEVLSGARRPWRTAAECIDWSIPCPSIFARKRPLKDATLRRIAHGVMRYVVNAASPFIVGVGGPAYGGKPKGVDGPIGTLTTENHRNVVDAAIVPITHTGDAGRAHSMAEPLRTITTANGGEFARATVTLAPHVTKFRTGSIGSDAADPMPTVTANGDSARPAGATPLGVASALLTPFYGNKTGGKVRACNAVDDPLRTQTADPTFGLVTAFLSTFYTNGGKHSVDEPAPTITAESNHHAVVCAHMEQANTGRVGHPIAKPVSTITSAGAHQRLVETMMIEAGAFPPEQMERAVQVAAFLVKYYGAAEHGQAVDRPLDAVTTKARFAVITVTIDAITYVVVDIGMRMLTRRELANAQGFPGDYILDPIGPNGKPLSISSSIRMIGNSVCPDMAEALVAANDIAGVIERLAAGHLAVVAA